MVDDVALREARDDDAEGLIALIGGCFAEYPGCLLDVDGEIPELRAIATHYGAAGGRFWVATRGMGGAVVGSVGCTPVAGEAEGSGIELRKLYVTADARRTGLGGRLTALVEDEARRRGAAFIELWSDTRFATAHGFYARRGYVRGAHTRDLHDLSHSVEYYFCKALPVGPG